MIIDGSTMKLGGNRLKHWFGTKIQKWGSNIIEKNKHLIVTNPSCRLLNPFTLIVNFTVGVTDKYQVVIQGDYKKIYKEAADSVPEISEKEMFMIIDQKQRDWFKKE